MLICPECKMYWIPGTPEVHFGNCSERPELRQRRMEEQVSRILAILESWQPLITALAGENVSTHGYRPRANLR